MACKQQKGRGGLDLEHRDRRSGIVALALREHLGKFGVLDQSAAAFIADAKPLVEAYQVRRGVNVHPLARGFQNGARKRDCRTFAIGASNVDHRRQAMFRMPQPPKQPLDAVERKIDALGMQLQEPGQHALPAVCSLTAGFERFCPGKRAAHASAGNETGDCSAPAGAFVSRRQSRAMVARSSRR